MENQNQIIINFLQSNEAEFFTTATHPNMDMVIEATKVKNLVSKADKFKVARIGSYFIFFRNEHVICDQKITTENGKFHMHELTMKSYNKMESLL